MAMEKLAAPDSGSYVLTAYKYVYDLTSTLAGQVKYVGYQAVHNALYGGVGYTVVGLIVMFWLMNNLKNGSITREEMFKAGTWVVLTCFVFGVMGSLGAYKEFVGWFTIPENWFKGALAGAMGGTSTESIMTSIVNRYENYYFTANNAIWDYQYKNSKAAVWGFDFKEAAANLVTFFKMIPLDLMQIPMMIFLVGLGTVDIITNFTKNVLLGLAPMLVPCIIYSKLRPYFFSWLKLYISITLYMPICMLIGGLGSGALRMMPPPASLVSLSGTGAAAFVPAIAFILASVLLLKVPGWVQSITGASDGGSGVGGAVATAAAMGAGGMLAGKIGGGILKGFGQKFAQAANDGKGLGGALAKGLGGALGAVPGVGAAGSAVAAAGRGAAALGKASATTAKAPAAAIANGFRSVGSHFKGGKDEK